MTNHLVIGRDQYGTLLQVSFHLNDAITAIPAMGEVWTVGRNGNLWFLEMRGDNGSETTSLAALGPGDRRIDTSGNLYLNSNQLFINGQPFQTTTAGTLITRPLVADVPAGTFYYATDQDVLYLNTGTWQRMGFPAGTTALWFSATPPTGWIKYDGTALPSSSGIYAHLATHLGGTATPNTKGRMPVGLGTHADVATIGASDGLPDSSRRPIHKHTVVRSADVVLSHPGYELVDIGTSTGFGGGGGDGVPTADQAIAQQPNFTVGPQTGNEPIDGPAWITFLFIAKL